MDAGRTVSERGLVAEAVRHLTTDALGHLPFEALGPTKALLKRFFSDQPWGPADDQALADAVGPGTGWWRHQLDHDLVLEFGWADGRFELKVTLPSEPGPSPGHDQWAVTFAGPVTPEPTPNPRTVLFRTGPIHEGESRPFMSGEPIDDARVSHLFRQFPDITDVLVATDFVAVSLRRPERWETLLGPVLDEVTQQFCGDPGPGDFPSPGGPQTAGGGRVTRQRRQDRQEGRLERAWRELGSLRPQHGPDFERVRAAAGDEDTARRQVAASLLKEADPASAQEEWQRLVHDRSRLVRRATADAIVDASREELRPLLEQALGDDDPWVRWKAVRGLSDLGAAASRDVIRPLASDPDFRVRLEARAALRA